MFIPRNEGYSRSALMLLNLCAATALMLAVGEVGYKMWKQHNPDLGQDGRNQAAATTNTRPAAQYRIEQIIAAHLFGQNVVAQPVAVQAPETRLKLSLLGVVASENPSMARALVARPSAPTRSYAVGEIVDQTDAKIHAIQSTRVLLSRGGRLESLAIARPEMNAAIGRRRPERARAELLQTLTMDGKNRAVDGAVQQPQAAEAEIHEPQTAEAEIHELLSRD